MKAYKPSIILSPLRSIHLRLYSVLEKYITPDLNPLANTGAIANLCFIIAIISGVLLLLWYSPSVFVAYESVVDMMTNKYWYAGIIRSIHRYSSDACVFFMILHIVEILSQEKFDKPRWPAWVTGVFLFLVIWFEGWIGYWLVWDEGARYIAVNTSKLMDVLPIFAEPLSRSFLTKESVNSLFFFVVFFGHMLIPLAVAILLWIHVTRISKPNLFTKKPLTTLVLVSLVIISIIIPAPYGPAADLQSTNSTFPLDYYFTLPLYIINYMSPLFAWLLLFLATLIISSIPFFQKFKKARATYVDQEKCHACRACYNDCPFNAIEMIEIKKSESGKSIIKADISKDLCLQCGICVGSCSTDAIQFPSLQKVIVEEKIRSWIKNLNEKFQLTFVCNDAFHHVKGMNEITGECSDLPGHRLVMVPNAAWINMLTLEEIIVSDQIVKINIISGAAGSSSSRTAHLIGHDRIVGKRYPKLSTDEINKKKINFYNFYNFEWNKVLENLNSEKKLTKQNNRKYIFAVLVFILMGILIAIPSNITYKPQNLKNSTGKLIVSFKHSGIFKEDKNQENIEVESKLKHMKRKNSASRNREKVVLEIYIDGKSAIKKSYGPSGIFGDGASLGTEEFEVTTGEHLVEIILKESESGKGEIFRENKNIQISQSRNVVVLFDKGKGFKWY